MKHLIRIASIVLSLSVHSQEIQAAPEILSCKSGTELAKKNFDKGIFKVYSFGLVIQTEVHGFDAYYKEYIFKNYGIKLIHKGCIVMPDDECYSNTMTDLLHKKFGNDLFEVARTEARAQFDKKNH